MNLDRNFFDSLRRYFPEDKILIDEIERTPSNQKEEVINILEKKIKLLRIMASTARTRAAISSLRELRRKVLAPKNPWYKTSLNFIESIARAIGTGKASDFIVDVVCKFIENEMGIKIPDMVQKGAKFIAFRVLIKPTVAFSKWTKDTIVEAVDVMKESLRESKILGLKKRASIWKAINDTGTFISFKVKDSVDNICSEVKVVVKKIGSSTTNVAQKIMKKTKSFIR